jgi:hypothetical protein
MRSKLITLVTTVSLLTLSVMGPALATRPGSSPDLEDGHKITICHATNSETNPYVVITIDIAAWNDEGGQGHSPEHHVNRKTGDHDVLWDEVNGCAGDDGGGTTST